MTTYFYDVKRGSTEITLEYSITGLISGSFVGGCYDGPDEGGEAEIVCAFTDNAPNYQITDDECERWTALIEEEHDHTSDDDMSDFYDSLYA